MYRLNYCEIDLNAVRHNMDVMRRYIAPGAKFMAVVKANAYGHGAAQVAWAALGHGADALAVAIPEEGEALRRAGIKAPILVLGGILTRAAAEADSEHSLTQVVFDAERVHLLNLAGTKTGRPVQVHLGLDTGMGRIGYQWDDPAAIEELAEAASYPGLDMIGIFSHFSSEDFPDKYWSREQKKRFDFVLQQFREKKGMVFPLNSLANSPATSHNPAAHYGLCRPGGSLYGRYQGGFNRLEGVEAVMTVKALVIQVKDVPDGFSVSYMRSGRTSRPSRIATLPLGYGDGFPRSWGNGKGYVLIDGRRAPIIGVICMDQFMIDVTDLPDVKEGDEAILIGKSGGETIVLGDIGKVCGMLSNEVSLNLQLRLPYKFIR